MIHSHSLAGRSYNLPRLLSSLFITHNSMRFEIKCFELDVMSTIVDHDGSAVGTALLAHILGSDRDGGTQNVFTYIVPGGMFSFPAHLFTSRVSLPRDTVLPVQSICHLYDFLIHNIFVEFLLCSRFFALAFYYSCLFNTNSDRFFMTRKQIFLFHIKIGSKNFKMRR